MSLRMKKKNEFLNDIGWHDALLNHYLVITSNPFRKERMAQIRARQAKAKFGDVREISAEDYVQEVNKAGDETYVILHLYKQVGHWWVHSLDHILMTSAHARVSHFVP